MRFRSASATALTFLLLLTSLLDVAGHELLCRDDPVRGGITAGSPLAGPQIVPVEAELDHDCPCCGLCGPRISLGPEWATDPVLVVAEVHAVRHGVLFVKPLPASHPSRGPPVC